jgi:hypothetical protein
MQQMIPARGDMVMEDLHHGHFTKVAGALVQRWDGAFISSGEHRDWHWRDGHCFRPDFSLAAKTLLLGKPDPRGGRVQAHAQARASTEAFGLCHRKDTSESCDTLHVNAILVLRDVV